MFIFYNNPSITNTHTHTQKCVMPFTCFLKCLIALMRIFFNPAAAAEVKKSLPRKHPR